MKRSMRAIPTIFVVAFTLLFTGCAPAPYMIATLTQLPFAGTPPTSTPYPTSTPRPTLTASITPSADESAGTGLTTTPDASEISLETATVGTAAAVPTAATELTLTTSPDSSAITPADCPPFTFDTDLPDPDSPEQYIGQHYDSFDPPEGINGWSAGLLEDESYSWAHVTVENREVYWIQKMVCRDSSGKAFWEIVSAQVLPKMNTRAHEVSTDICFTGGKKIPFVIAYGVYDPSKPAAPVANDFVGWPLQIKGAWEMKEKFVQLETQDLTCIVQEP